MHSSTDGPDATSQDETAYLLNNRANAERLLAALDRTRHGEFEQHDLVLN